MKKIKLRKPKSTEVEPTSASSRCEIRSTTPCDEVESWVSARGYEVGRVVGGSGLPMVRFRRANEPVHMVGVGHTLVWDGTWIHVEYLLWPEESSGWPDNCCKHCPNRGANG